MAAGLLILVVGSAVGWVADRVYVDQWPPWAPRATSVPRSGPSVAAQPASSPSAPTPSGPTPARAVKLEPQAVILRPTDLPDGFHVVRQGQVAFRSGEQTGSVPSWDVVLTPSSDQPAGYVMVESLVAVLSDSSAAASAMETTAQGEQAQQAIAHGTVPGLGDQQTVWVERAPDRPSYGIARVTWHYRNVLAQVSVLGPIEPLQPGQAIELAKVEQDRISAVATPV